MWKRNSSIRRETRLRDDEGKVKVVPVLFLTEHHAMKAFSGSGRIAPRIHWLGTRWRWVVSFTPRPLCPRGKSLWYPLDRRRTTGIYFPTRTGLFLFVTVLRPALRSTQSPIHWTVWDLFRGVKLTSQSRLVPRLKMRGAQGQL